MFDDKKVTEELSLLVVENPMLVTELEEEYYRKSDDGYYRMIDYHTQEKEVN